MYYSCGIVRSVYVNYFSAYDVIGHLVISRRWCYILCDNTCVGRLHVHTVVLQTVVVYSMSTRLVCTSSEVEQSSA